MSFASIIQISSLLPWLQDETSLKVVHYIGAGLVFLGGTLYCCLETVIGRHISRTYQHQHILWKTYIRALICIALIVFCIVGKSQCPYMVIIVYVSRVAVWTIRYWPPYVTGFVNTDPNRTFHYTDVPSTCLR